MRKIILNHEVSFKKILEALLSSPLTFKWNILFFDAFLKHDSNFDVNKIEELIETGRNGYEIDVLTLKKLSADIEQLHQLLLVGNNESLDLLPIDDSTAWYEKNEIVVEVIDSCTNWEVWVKNNEIAQKIKYLAK
jgi:hypothetical protein